MFMVFIFGPSEIFFANETHFDFVYGEFAGYLAIIAIIASFFGAIIFSLFPNMLYKIGMSVILGISLAGYLQVMFLNQQLDLLGLNPDGYHVSQARAISNLCVWLIIILTVVFLSLWKEKIWQGLVKFVPAFLIAIQTVALASLLFTADDHAFHYEDWHYYFAGTDQFTVSSNENIILIVLDYFGNQDMQLVQDQYPDLMDCLHDFTYYNNADCNYYGTFPAMPYMLTGQPVDPSIPIAEWCNNIWTSTDTLSFYQQLREKGYTSHLYTVEPEYICGDLSLSTLSTCFDNIENIVNEVDIFYKKLFKTLTKMSCYRMSPEIMKNSFYTLGTEYSDLIVYNYDFVYHNNDEFYSKLLEKGIRTDSESNYFIVQHLLGLHDYTINHKCEPSKDSTLEETARGCMVMVEEYLNQLKTAGVYDNATIIVTADHGDFIDSQVIFYIKQPGEQHDVSPVTNAPISHTELRPTLAAAAGLDSTQFGQTIYDFYQDQQRERQVWIRSYSSDHPPVTQYTQNRQSRFNVYNVYTYTGDYSDLLKQWEQNTYDVVPMYDCIF